ncbi:DUF2225 domain-containing protein [Alkalicoccus chagannorensis]|uniref:DUF2225 domain-containing protein n=1 Tax=Alkalicoccus chagannorensis TaxID=427072 RepID=UPI0003FD84AD|nr:DUF2225 domain-containing protein [Alkalicoccus chagannorensis]
MSKDIPPLYEKTITCPMCSNVYTTLKLRSRFIRVESSANDFYKTYKDPAHNPLLYEVNVCDACGCAYMDSFHLGFHADHRERFAEKVTAAWNPRSLGGKRSYDQAASALKLALLTAELTEQKYVVQAGLALKLSWLYRTMEKENDQDRFRRRACRMYEQSLYNGDFQDREMSEMTLRYLLGELYRQEGDKEEAGRHFSAVIQHKQKALEPQIEAMAREQWYDMRHQTTK